MRNTHKLTANAIKKLIANPPERTTYFADGGGLNIQITPAGTASWIYRFQLHNRSREMGLGSFEAVSLAAARAKVAEAARLRAGGIDPLLQKVHARKTARREAEHRLSFGDAAAKFIALRAPQWSRANADDWRSSLRRHAAALTRLDVSEIDTSHVLTVLEAIWSEKNATACAVRQRVEAVIDWATSGGYRTGENPARFKNHLQNLLPMIPDKTENRPSLPYKKIYEFMNKLRAEPGDVARAMEFIILTGARSSEATGCCWREIDVAGKVWHCPPERMKADVAHDVPLSEPALALLCALPGEHKPDDRLFNSAKGKQVSDTVLSSLLRKLGYAKGTATTHGFRATLRTWLGERTQASDDVCDACIAHDKRPANTTAYARTRHFEARVPLMTMWADFIDTPFVTATVLPIRATP